MFSSSSPSKRKRDRDRDTDRDRETGRETDRDRDRDRDKDKDKGVKVKGSPVEYKALYKKLSAMQDYKEKEKQLKASEVEKIRRIRESEVRWMEENHAKYTRLMERRSGNYRSEKEISKNKRDYAVAKQRLWEARMQLLDNIDVYNMGSHTIPLKVDSPVGGSRTETETEAETETEIEIERETEILDNNISLAKHHRQAIRLAPEATEEGIVERRRPVVVNTREDAQFLSKSERQRQNATSSSSSSYEWERRGQNYHQQQAMPSTTRNTEDEPPSASARRERGEERGDKERRRRNVRQRSQIGGGGFGFGFGRVSEFLGRGGMNVLRLGKWCFLTTLQTAEDVVVCSDILVSTSVGAARNILSGLDFRAKKGKDKGGKARQREREIHTDMERDRPLGRIGLGTGDFQREKKERRFGRRSRMLLMRCAVYAVGVPLVLFLYETASSELEKRRALPTSRVTVAPGEEGGKIVKKSKTEGGRKSERSRRLSKFIIIPGG